VEKKNRGKSVRRGKFGEDVRTREGSFLTGKSHFWFARGESAQEAVKKRSGWTGQGRKGLSG